MSNFDVRLKTKFGEVYLNFFPLLGALKAYLRKENYSSFEKVLVKLIKNLNFFIKSFPIFQFSLIGGLIEYILRVFISLQNLQLVIWVMKIIELKLKVVISPVLKRLFLKNYYLLLF